MTNEDLKQAVREQYSKIASSGSSCCGPNCGCSTSEQQVVSISMNDTYQNADQKITETADLGLGCGTPTAFADFEKGMTVLDLGSGAGIDVFLSAQRVGKTGRAIGLDMTDAMLERANANKEKLGIANAEFRKGEIENMPVASNSVDRVISNCVINLVPDKRKAFSEIYRVLKIGGRFTISDVVSVGKIPSEVRNDMFLWAGCVAGAMEKEDYLNVIKAAGFVNVAVASEKPYPSDDGIPFRLESITVTGMK
ncbi:MAG: arsenite methyltransferase [Bacteroidota bacterium]|nr:arsenite methyltransferase [Bacteroidota bacterium]